MTTEKRKQQLREAQRKNAQGKREQRDKGALKRLDRWLTPSAWKAAVKAIEEEKLKEDKN
jgi:hypothetical protein